MFRFPAAIITINLSSSKYANKQNQYVKLVTKQYEKYKGSIGLIFIYKNSNMGGINIFTLWGPNWHYIYTHTLSIIPKVNFVVSDEFNLT